MNIQGRTAIVTGATRGMGRAIAQRLAAEGANLVLAARHPADLDSVAADLRTNGTAVQTAPTDVTAAGEVAAMVELAIQHFDEVNILVNNAFWGPPGSLEETTEDFWDRTLDTCLKGPFLCTRAVFPIMKKNGGGRIVNIGSLAGKVGEDNRTAYCAAKWGLEGLTAALQIEMVKHNIHVHLISPAATDTSFWRPYNLAPKVVAKMIPPETIAEAVAWVLSQPDHVHIPDVPVYNYRNPFEGKSSPFAND